MNGYLQIGYAQTAVAGLLIVANLGLSAALELGLGRRLVIAALRMTVQLFLVGLVLEWVFSLENPLPVLAMAAAMTAIAGVSAVNRTQRRFAGVYWSSLVSVTGAAFFVTGLALVGIVRVDPWFDPQYLIPLLGMVLGNTLNGISLSLDRFVESLVQRRDAVEATLALGGTRWEAAHDHIRDAMRVGLIPMINSMMVIGIVSLPGMMTGQILAGAAPTDAVRYQIVIMFMIASAAALGAFGIVFFSYHRLFDEHHRLRLDRVRKVVG